MENKIRLLYAEDDPVCAAQTRMLLESRNFQVAVVPDGTQAWKAYRLCKPDLLLFDLEMPGKSGLELIRMVRKEDISTPIVLFTSHAEPENEIAALDAGAKEFISKTVHPDILVYRLMRTYKQICHPLLSPHVYLLTSRTSYNSVARTLTIDDKIFPLKPIDGRLLQLLCAKFNDTATKEYLLWGVWKHATINKEKELKKYISHVRALLKPDQNLAICHTEEGYSLHTL